MDEPMLVIGSGSGARISLCPRGGVTDSWIDCLITVRAGHFTGEYLASLRTDEFERFQADLERLYRELVGSGGFHSMEMWVDIQVTGDGRGHFTGSCRLMDRAGDGNRLECDIEFDQSDVPAMLEQLRLIRDQFPRDRQVAVEP